jgi:hypothetical protein
MADYAGQHPLVSGLDELVDELRVRDVEDSQASSGMNVYVRLARFGQGPLIL